MQKCYFSTSYLLFCAFCSLLQKIGIREEILNSMGLYLSASSFRYCIAYSYSDFSPYNYSIFAYNEKERSCSPMYDVPEENIIDDCSEQLHDLQFYKVTHCLPAEGFMYSFEEEVEENVNRINAVKLKATAEICIVERHPFSENFLLKRTGMFFLKSLELCLAHCRVLSMRGKCHAVLFSAEEKVCLLLRQNQPLQSRDVMRKSESQLFALNYCYYNMTESSESRYYNGSGKIINLRIGSMRVQCTVHEIPLLSEHMKHQCLLWNSKTFRHCIKFCVRQFRANLCNAVYFEAEEKTCLHLLLNASQALNEYSESKRETVHFIEKCVEVAERHEYLQQSAINRIQSDETSISSASRTRRPRCCRTRNVREQELDFFYYVPSENIQVQYAKLYEFFEICKVQLLNISIIRNAFTIQTVRKIYSLNRCLHICRRHTSCMAILFSQLHHKCKKIFKGRSSNSISVHAHEMVVALKECFKDRPDERKWNPKPLIYYFNETQEICAAEIYKQKNLTSWEVMTIDKDVSNFQVCLLKCILNDECIAINYFLTKECYLIKPAKENNIFVCLQLQHNMTESSESRYYNGSGKIINLRIRSMRVQCTVHEIPLRRAHMKLRWLLWDSKTLLHCIKFCAQQFWVNLCNAVYFEAEEKTCLHLLLNATQALYEYSESKKETVHFIEKCVEVNEQQEYQQGSAINRIQPDETRISSPSRPISSTTHNIREPELDFFHYVAAENVKEGHAKLYEFFEICEVQLLNIGLIRNAFAIEIPQKIYSLNRCLHICRRHTSCMAILFSQLDHKCKKIFKGRSSSSILVHADETVVALKECFKDRPDERKCNTEPLIYYFNETQEICAAEIYKQKNLTSWEIMTIDKDVSNFQMQKCYFNTSYLLFCAFCSVLQKIGIREEILNSMGLFLSAASFKYCIAHSYSDFSPYNYSIFAYNEKARSCSPLYDIALENIIDNCSDQLHDLQFYKVTHCLPVNEQQEYQQGSAINRIQPDETRISSPSRPISSTTHNIREPELDFFHYVAAENVKEGHAKLYEFFEICEVQLLNIGLIRNAFAIEIPQKIYSLNRCLHICRRHTSCMAILFSQLDHKCKKIFKGRSSSSILVHADETVVALKECFKDRPDERKCNTEPLMYYFEETQEICAVEIYKQKNLTSWEVMAINKDVSNFQACLFKCIINNECCAINYFPTKECYLIKPADESHIFIVKDNSIFAEELYCESGTLVDVIRQK
ncbi:hypothetical protein T06_7997 [Trichinella sp. T6]|nr:hypothetical protein T06_7997 [Trichinella sp. T6]